MRESKRDFFERYVRAIADLDFSALEQMIHPDYVADYPQSGERFKGFEAFRLQLERYPGGLPAARFDDPHTRILGDEERWAITPGYTVLPLEAPERFTTVTRAPYPDGSRWWVVSILTLKGDKIWYAETFFAPEFEPPEWRKDIVEIMPFTVVPLTSPNEYTITYRILYPGGQWWYVVGHLEIRDDKLYRMENYFAPELPAPLVESIAAFGHG